MGTIGISVLLARGGSVTRGTSGQVGQSLGQQWFISPGACMSTVCL